MAKVKFTAGRIAEFQCAADGLPSFLWDSVAPGLGLRVTPAGAKSYIFQAKLKGQVIRVTIGAPSAWSIAAAQREAARLRVIIDNGQDPRQVKAEAIAADSARADALIAETAAKLVQAKRESVTLGMVWSEYVDDRRSRWSAWHIRDHETVVSPGGVQKKRGRGITEPGPLASLLDVRLVDLTGRCIGDWIVR